MAVDDIYTKSLLHMDGADASTTFIDESGKNWTRSGNAQIDTAQYKFGGASGLFDGVDDYLLGDGSSDFADGTNDFTIDLWFRVNTATAQSSMVLYDTRPNAIGGAYQTIYIGSQKLSYYTGSGAVPITGTTTVTYDTWHHCALVRQSGNTKLYLDGTQEGSTYSDPTNYSCPASRPVIAGKGYNLTEEEFGGWIDEFRKSNIARWTTNFTPPTAPYGGGGQVIMFS
jgi:hypothetical protein